MKNRFLNFVLLFVFALCAKQNLAQNPGWILAPNYIPDMEFPSFPQPLPTATGGYDGSPAVYSQNIQMDKDGNILFWLLFKMLNHQEKECFLN